MGTSVTDACESGQLKDNVGLSAGGRFQCLTETSYLSVRPSVHLMPLIFELGHPEEAGRASLTLSETEPPEYFWGWRS